MKIATTHIETLGGTVNFAATDQAAEHFATKTGHARHAKTFKLIREDGTPYKSKSNTKTDASLDHAATFTRYNGIKAAIRAKSAAEANGESCLLVDLA